MFRPDLGCSSLLNVGLATCEFFSKSYSSIYALYQKLRHALDTVIGVGTIAQDAVTLGKWLLAVCLAIAVIRFVKDISATTYGMFYGFYAFARAAIGISIDGLIETIQSAFESICPSAQSCTQDEQITFRPQGTGSIIALLAGTMAYATPDVKGRTLSMPMKIAEAAKIITPIAAAAVIAHDSFATIITHLPNAMQEFATRIFGVGSICCNANTQRS